MPKLNYILLIVVVTMVALGVWNITGSSTVAQTQEAK